jgi:hypothetical protein
MDRVGHGFECLQEEPLRRNEALTTNHQCLDCEYIQGVRTTSKAARPESAMMEFGGQQAWAQTAKKADTRAKRIAQLVAMLERGDTPHP